MDNDTHAAFLRRQAAALRELAQRSPQIADPLRRLAERLEAMADEADRGSVDLS
jgi:hypothetical protein